ncbi:P-loop containing nucleoside triphosphate hydrolase protein [Hyaloraphidium curvatum]|nr:P-loop containing nucleoside triphosphate hydrolase protein [Hyaloraphidium curvatum]
MPRGVTVEGGGRGNQDYLATLALFVLVPQLNLHRLLPPAHRDLIGQWEEEKKGKGEDEKRKREEERARWIQKLLDRRKEVGGSKGDGKARAGDAEAAEGKAAEAPGAGISERGDAAARLAQLRGTLERRRQSRDYLAFLEQRAQLPVFAMRDHIVRTIRDNAVTIISGETGSGKSTQVPSFLLEDLIMFPGEGPGDPNAEVPSIVVTQPRRISASSLSQRVSKEIADPSGPGSPGSWIGYSVRLEDRTGRDTMVTFATTGILLRRLEQDPELKGVTCVVVDEVHERTADGDYLVRLLKDLLPRRPGMRVVLMSATINLAKLSAYFPLAPVVSVSGRTFPVEVRFLEEVVQRTGYVLDPESEFAKRRDRVRRDMGKVEVKGKGGSSKTVKLEWEEDEEQDDDEEEPDPALYSRDTRAIIRRLDKELINYDLIENLVAHICETEPECGGRDGGGAVVIFLPGLQEIRRCHSRLSTLPMLARDPDAFWLIPLHSALTGSSQDQELAFRIPPRGVRKIVIATNIAETGITIPDCSHVIDSGKVKEVRYDDRRQLTQLKEVWISRASAEQRKGRAGRVREGTCWRLFTKARYGMMHEFPVPELLRSTLDEIILRCKLAGVVDVALFLSEMLDPPQPAVVQRTVDKLRLCQALDTAGSLTPLGYHLAHLPVDVHLGRMLITGALLQCLDPVLTICASLSLGKSPFLRPFGKEAEADRARLPFKVGHSDLLTLANVHRRWRELALQPGTKQSALRQWCMRNYVSEQNMQLIEETRWQLYRYIAGVGFADAAELRALEAGAGRSGGRRGEGAFCLLPAPLDRRSSSVAVVNAAIVSGLYPNVMVRDRANKDNLVEAGSKGQQAVFVHPSCVFSFDKLPPGRWWFASHSKVKSSRVYAWDVNLVGTSTVVGLFGGALEVLPAKKVLSIDGNIMLKCAPKTGFVFTRLRQELDQILGRRIKNPSPSFTSAENETIEVMCSIVEMDIDGKLA